MSIHSDSAPLTDPQIRDAGFRLAERNLGYIRSSPSQSPSPRHHHPLPSEYQSSQNSQCQSQLNPSSQENGHETHWPTPRNTRSRHTMVTLSTQTPQSNTPRSSKSISVISMNREKNIGSQINYIIYAVSYRDVGIFIVKGHGIRDEEILEILQIPNTYFHSLSLQEKRINNN